MFTQSYFVEENIRCKRDSGPKTYLHTKALPYTGFEETPDAVCALNQEQGCDEAP